MASLCVLLYDSTCTPKQTLSTGPFFDFVCRASLQVLCFRQQSAFQSFCARGMTRSCVMCDVWCVVCGVCCNPRFAMSDWFDLFPCFRANSSFKV